MSSEATLETLLKLAPHRDGALREFASALRDRHTYDPVANGHALFGFLWGLPIPFFSISIDLWVTGRALTLGCLWEHPIHLFFLAHPFLFAILFGAMGTVRRRKDRQIARLVEELERHVVDLAEANERLKELDRLKAEFMANVTHELKTPLVAIRGYNEALLEDRFGPISDAQRTGLVVAVRNVDRLQKLIDELLEFERIDSGDFKLAPSEFDVVALVDGVLRDFQPVLDRKRLTVQRALPGSLRIRADRDRIAHVFQNLISNAVKFSSEGAAIGVSARASDHDGECLFTVWDRGPGIPTAAQKFLFTRFWQADGPGRRRQGGTGLGLAIVKAILDAHHSTLRVVSAEGEGTSVHFTLPLAESGPEATEPVAGESAARS